MSAQAKKPLAVLAAGGTGGHMTPAQSLARELLDRSWRVALITDRRGGGFGPDLPQVDTHQISAAGIAGGDAVKKAVNLTKLGVGWLEAHVLLARLHPSVVVGFGGYASLPTVLAASQLGRSVVLHEQNAVAGRANRMMAGRAKAIALSFPKTQGLPEAALAKSIVTGNPVRPAIEAIASQPMAVPEAGGAFRLLVIGGSQGATIFNDVVPDALAGLSETQRKRLRVTQQVRGDRRAEIAKIYDELSIQAEFAPYFDDLPQRLKSAHLVIARSGASTVAELAAAGRPALLVPYPFATDNHQRANAEAFAAAGGGFVLDQHTLNAADMTERLAALMEDPNALTEAARAATTFGRPGAAAKLADLAMAAGESGGALQALIDKDRASRREEAA